MRTRLSGPQENIKVADWPRARLQFHVGGGPWSPGSRDCDHQNENEAEAHDAFVFRSLKLLVGMQI